MPQEFSALDAQIIHPEYRDEWFQQGFGARIQMPSEEFFRAFGRTTSEVAPYQWMIHRLVHRLGVLQIACPDLSPTDVSFLQLDRAPQALHQDSGISNGQRDTVILRGASDVIGDTVIFPTRVALQKSLNAYGFLGGSEFLDDLSSTAALLRTDSSSYTDRQGMWQWRDYLQKRYDRSTEQQKLAFHRALVEGNPPGLVRHTWRDQYNVVAFSNVTEMHMPDAQPSGRLYWRFLQKSTDVQRAQDQEMLQQVQSK